jgi:hypothetical protein
VLTGRTITPELMDDPAADRDELDRSLRFIRAVNRRLGGTAAALGALRRWSAGWVPGALVRLLDVGTGSADIPLAMCRWAERAGFHLRVTAVDAHPATLELARRHVGDCPGAGAGVELVLGDARRLTDLFGPGSFDYAHAGMFLHHLHDVDVLTVLKAMDRLATRGIIWNDLVRGRVEALAVRLLTAGRPRMVRHDALASVRAGFTRREALDLAGRVGLQRVAWRRHLFGRFTLTSEKVSG